MSPGNCGILLDQSRSPPGGSTLPTVRADAETTEFDTGCQRRSPTVDDLVSARRMKPQVTAR